MKSLRNSDHNIFLYTRDGLTVATYSVDAAFRDVNRSIRPLSGEVDEASVKV